MNDHDYEPGDGTHPMQTDPLCGLCNQRKGHPDHDVDETDELTARIAADAARSFAEELRARRDFYPARQPVR